MEENMMLMPAITHNPLYDKFPVSLYGFFDQTIFHIAAYVIAVTAIIASVYLCTFFIKKLIGLFKKEK